MTEPLKTPTVTDIMPSSKAAYLDTVNADSALQPTTLGGMMRLAEVISRAGLCPKHLRNDAGSTMLVIAAAQQLGLPWFIGLQKAYVIDGKVAFEAVVLEACARRSPRCKVLYLESVTDEVATMVVQTTDMPQPIKATYSYADAQKAGLSGKGPWNSYRKDMLVARLRSNVSRRYFGEATLGLYSVEELRDADPISEPMNVTPIRPISGTAELLDRLAEEPVKAPEPPVVVAEVVEEDDPFMAPMAPEPTKPVAKPTREDYWLAQAREALGEEGPLAVRQYMTLVLKTTFEKITPAQESKLKGYLQECAEAEAK